MTGARGWNVESFRDDDRAFVELIAADGNDVQQAELTLDQFNRLSKATDWDQCGAQSADDARIPEAAVDFIEGLGLEWQRKGKDGLMASI